MWELLISAVMAIALTVQMVRRYRQEPRLIITDIALNVILFSLLFLAVQLLPITGAGTALEGIDIFLMAMAIPPLFLCCLEFSRDAPSRLLVSILLFYAGALFLSPTLKLGYTVLLGVAVVLALSTIGAAAAMRADPPEKRKTYRDVEILFIVGVTSPVWIAGGVEMIGEGWPISMWLLQTFAVAAFATLVRFGLFLTRRQSEGFPRTLIGSVAHALQDAAIAISFGIGVVVLLQAQVSMASNDYLNTENVTRNALKLGRLGTMERWASAAYEFAHGATSLQALLLAFPLLIAAQIALPHMRIVSTTIRIRNTASALVLVLLGMSSFTFFGRAAMERHDLGQNIARIEAQVRSNEAARSQMAALAWVQKAIRDLPPAEQRDLGQKLQSSDQQQVKSVARLLARAARPVDTRNEPQAETALAEVAKTIDTTPGGREQPAFLRATLNGVWQTLVGAPPDGFSDHQLDQTRERLRTEERVLTSELQKGTIEIASNIIAELIPGDPAGRVEIAAREFINEMVTEAAREVFHNQVPHVVTTVQAAQVWINDVARRGGRIGWDPGELAQASRSAAASGSRDGKIETRTFEIERRIFEPRTRPIRGR